MAEKPAGAIKDDRLEAFETPAYTDQSNSFQSLVKALSDALGPSSGIDSDDIDVNDLRAIMTQYKSREDEWSPYALPDPSRPYTRNLVDEGNGKSNLLIVVWTPGRQSPVHDHANAHCIMKILKGSLVETLYETPVYDETRPEKDGTITQALIPKGPNKIYNEDEVTYISDKIGLHRIANASDQEYSVSLHLYTPPFAAKFGFNIFDENTSIRSHCKQGNFFSRQGQTL